MMPQSLYLNGAALHFNLGPYHSLQITKEIVVKDIPDLKFKLVLLVGSEGAIELEMKDNRTWAPLQRPYVLYLLITYILKPVCT